MYSRILVALDGSPLAESILAEVQRLAEGSGCQVRLLSVQELPPPVEGPSEEDERLLMLGTAPAIVTSPATHETRDQAGESVRDEAMEYLEEKAAPLRAAGIDVSSEVHFGTPAEVIAQVARDENFDLIAMATHGRSGLKRLLFGSVASQVVEHSSKPVLVVRPGHLEG
jgi:nucleotide-binding universal stress UspA family protein